MAISAEVVKSVLKAWANNYVEDVPAIHRDGQYLIEYDTLVNHINNLTYDDLANVKLEAEVDYYV